MGIIFCTGCQSTRDDEGGEYRKTNRSARWICKLCLEHKTESIYKAKTPYDPKSINRLLEKLWRKNTYD